MPHVTLYGYPTSPYVMKVACYLKYKKIPYDYVPVNPVSPVQIKFTGQRQVPVLTIGDEWRKDSTPLGIWLNENFPERNILGDSKADTQHILAIDRWISDHLITSVFRSAVDWESAWDSMRDGWLLARAVNNATPIPAFARVLWPFLVRRAKFIVDMVERLDRTESMSAMRERMRSEFLEHLGDGPFLGGRDTISLADLSAYPTIVSGYLMGMHQDVPFLRDDKVIAWCGRMQAKLPDNPLLVPDKLIEREMFWKTIKTGHKLGDQAT